MKGLEKIQTEIDKINKSIFILSRKLENYKEIFRKDQENFRLKDKIERIRKRLEISERKKRFLNSKIQKVKGSFISNFKNKYSTVLKRRVKTQNQCKRKLIDMEDLRDEIQEEYNNTSKRYRETLIRIIQDVDKDIKKLKVREYRICKRQFGTKHQEKYKCKELRSNNPRFNAIKKLKTWKKR